MEDNSKLMQEVIDNSNDFMNFMIDEFEKKKRLDEVKEEMGLMIQDHKNNIEDFKEKYGMNASRYWALLKWKKHCIEKGWDYDERGKSSYNK